MIKTKERQQYYSRKSTDWVHELVTRNHPLPHRVQPAIHSLQSPKLHLMRLRSDITIPEQLLRHAIPSLSNLSILRPFIEIIRRLPVHRFTKLSEQEDPVGLNAAAGMRVQWERIETQVLATFSSDGLVANLHGARVGDAIKSKPQSVLAVIANLRPTGLRVIVERSFGTEALYVVEVARRAGCDRYQARSFTSQIESALTGQTDMEVKR